MPIVEIDGKNYEINGDYPDGNYSKVLVTAGRTITNWNPQDFIRLIPNAKRKQIFSLATSNAEVGAWVNMLKIVRSFTNDEQWFIDGLTALVDEAVITQNQMDKFT